MKNTITKRPTTASRFSRKTWISVSHAPTDEDSPPSGTANRLTVGRIKVSSNRFVRVRWQARSVVRRHVELPRRMRGSAMA